MYRSLATDLLGSVSKAPIIAPTIKNKQIYIICIIKIYDISEYRRGHDHMVVGFTTTYAISAYHH